MQLYFGNHDRQLFGVYHQPGAGDRKTGILLCNPFGIEAIRAHRIFRILAGRLSALGHPVLRFDYFGSGDSAGPCEAFSVAGAINDILKGHQELTDISGARRVVWIGLRLGAGLALKAAETKPRGLAGLVLWEPVLRGDGYLEELHHQHHADLASMFECTDAEVVHFPALPTGEVDAMGIEISAQARGELNQFAASTMTGRSCRAAVIIADTQNRAMQDLSASMESVGVRVQLTPAQDDQNWNTDAAVNAFSTPMKTLDLIVESVGTLK